MNLVQISPLRLPNSHSYHDQKLYNLAPYLLSIFNVQRSTFNVHLSTFNLQRSTL